MTEKEKQELNKLQEKFVNCGYELLEILKTDKELELFSELISLHNLLLNHIK